MSQYYDNIEQCTLFAFRDVMVKGDFKSLFIKGDYKESEAKKAWENIYDEYNESVKSKSVNISFELRKQAEVINNEYSMLTNCLFAITEGAKINIINDNQEVNIDQFIKLINTYGYRFEKSKGIANEVVRIEKQLRNYKTKIEQIITKIKAIDEQGKEWTFDNTIDSVERFRGIAFDNNTTVLKFVVTLNALIKQGENKKNNE